MQDSKFFIVLGRENAIKAAPQGKKEENATKVTSVLIYKIQIFIHL